MPELATSTRPRCPHCGRVDFPHWSAAKRHGKRCAAGSPRRRRMPNEGEILLGIHVRESFPGERIEPEFQFDPERKFRFDYALPDRHVGFECDGSIWTQGRHTRGAGFLSDLRKFNLAASAGWRVYRFATEDVLAGEDLPFLRAEQERKALP